MNGDRFTAPAPSASRPVEYASFARRLGAALLDSLVWIIGFGLFNPVEAGDETAAAIYGLVVASAWFNYFAICEWRWGQTIGKNATGIRVLPLQGGRLTWQAAALRNLLRIIDLPLAMLGVDYLIVRGSPRHQRLGDRAAKTIVVRERAREEEVAPVAEAERPAPQQPRYGAGAPTAAEIFGDAAEALGRQPAAGSAPGQAAESAPAGAVGSAQAKAAGSAQARSGASAEAERPGPGGGEDRGPARTEVSEGAPRESWTARGFPYAAWDVRQTVVGLLVGLLLGGIVAPLLVLPFDPDLDSTGALLVAQGLLAATLVAVSIGVASGGAPEAPARRELSLLGLRPVRPAAFGWMALAMVAYYVSAVIYGSLVGAPEQEDIARDLGLDAGVFVAIPVVILIVLLAPIAEEVFFRGMFFGGLRRRLQTVPAALISAAVFGGLHATTGVSAVPVLIVFGFVLALLYERTGSLVPGIVAHALNNALALAVAS